MMVEVSHTHPDGEVPAPEHCLGKALVDPLDTLKFPVFGMPHYGQPPPPPHPEGCTCDRNSYPYFRKSLMMVTS